MNEENIVEADAEKTETEASPATELLLEKADPVKRIIAFVIDLVISMLVGLIPLIGGIIGAFYMLFRDALPIEALEYKSVGKKILKLSVVVPEDTTSKIDYGVSARRNWMWALGPLMLLFLFIPIIGWVIDILLGVFLLILTIIEIVKIFSDEKGQRMGDRIAGTMVIES